MEGEEDEKIIVQSLIGASQLPFYLSCLKSLITFCQDRIELQLHTDGSFSQEAKDFIHSELNGTKVAITDSSENSWILAETHLTQNLAIGNVLWHS